MAQPEIRTRRQTAYGIFYAALAVVLVASLAAVVCLAGDVLLVLSLGVLFAVFLSGLAGVVDRFLPGGYRTSLGVVATSLALLAAGTVWFSAARVADRLDEFGGQLDNGLGKLRELADDHPKIAAIAGRLPAVEQLNSSLSDPDESADPQAGENQRGAGTDRSLKADGGSTAGLPVNVSDAFAATGKFFGSTLGAAVNLLLIGFVGLFLAADPSTYRRGVTKLVAPEHRHRAEEILDRLGHDLWRFLLGRGLSMLITGVGAGIVLTVLGVPLAFTLGVVTGLLTFIPNIGAAIALGLACLAALPQGLSTVGYVVAGYVALQMIESYVITPLITKKAVELPPALTLGGQAIFGVLFGFLGALCATHLIVIVKALVEEIYVEDCLEHVSAISDGEEGSEQPRLVG